MLMVCGLYQLFDRFFQTAAGERLEGISVFDCQTYGADQRMMGNTIIATDFGELVGYENHSGVTTLGAEPQVMLSPKTHTVGMVGAPSVGLS